MAQKPDQCEALWSTVDAICGDDLHLNATSFLNPPADKPFISAMAEAKSEIVAGGIGRLREVERYQNASPGKPIKRSCSIWLVRHRSENQA